MDNKILIIEDDKEIATMLKKFLCQKGFAVSVKNNGLDGIETAKSEVFDLILIDLMLPYKSGDELLKELRLLSSVPVIVMSAKTLTQTKIDLFDLGADDYVTKPFDLNELLARIKVNIGRYLREGKEVVDTELLSYGDITLTKSSKEVKIKNCTLSLTSKEYALLELFIDNPTKVYSKQNIYESIWEEQYAYDDNTVNTHISNIRKKIKEVSKTDYIETVWGMGYKLIKL